MLYRLIPHLSKYLCLLLSITKRFPSWLLPLIRRLLAWRRVIRAFLNMKTCMATLFKTSDINRTNVSVFFDKHLKENSNQEDNVQKCFAWKDYGYYHYNCCLNIDFVIENFVENIFQFRIRQLKKGTNYFVQCAVRHDFSPSSHWSH